MPVKGDQPPKGGPDAGSADPTDGREKLDWKSHYPPEARVQIRLEAIYIVVLFFVALTLIIVSWKGIPARLMFVTEDQATVLTKFCLYGFSGLLGGTVFGMKYLYRAVARGYWHVDRRLWRLLSPLIGLGVAFAIGALIHAGFITARTPASDAASIGVGFLIGYFADAAVAKLHEVAEVIFGRSAR